MEAGDLVRFSEDHNSQPGLDYTASWIGIVVECKGENLDQDSRLPRDWDEIRIMWSIPGTSKCITEYSEQWWSTLGYIPFEVMNESR